VPRHREINEGLAKHILKSSLTEPVEVNGANARGAGNQQQVRGIYHSDLGPFEHCYNCIQSPVCLLDFCAQSRRRQEVFLLKPRGFCAGVRQGYRTW